VVVRVLPLAPVTALDAVDVDHRHDEHRGVVAQPFRALGAEAGRLVARLRVAERLEEPRAIRRRRTEGSTAEDPLLVSAPPSARPLHAHIEGFDLHAAVAIDANDREALERVCRYLSRPAIAQDRLELRPGDVTRVTDDSPDNGAF
jgi:Putative transposase